MKKLTCDESASDDAGSAANYCDALDDDANDENAHVDQDSVLAGENLCEETAVETAKPSTELEDGRQPALLGSIANPVTHVWNVSVTGIRTLVEACLRAPKEVIVKIPEKTP